MGAYDPPQSLPPNGHNTSANNKQSDLKTVSSTKTAASIQRGISLPLNSPDFGKTISPTQDLDSSLNGEDVSSISSQPELPFSTLGLIGRADEKQALQEIVDAIVPSTRPPLASVDSHAPQHTLALISGPSGSGKSALAMDFQQQCFNRHAFFVTGKFDLKQMEEPYSGIKAALENLCHQMLALRQGSESNCASSAYSSGLSTVESLGEDPRCFSELQKLLVNELSANEVQALSKVLPEITSLVELSEQETKKVEYQRSPSMTSNMSSSLLESQQNVSDSSRIGYREQSDRLKFALQRFIQIACQFCPVVMMIDDLQWGDKPSMDLLKSWMLMDAGGTGYHSLLIMGCFRSKASEHSTILQDAIDEL